MRPLHVIVLHEGFRRGFGLGDVCRPISAQALLLVGAVVAFDKTVLLGMVGITDVNVDAQTGPKTNQSCWKIAACRTAHPTGIAIQRDALGASIPGEGECESLQSGFRREVGAHMGLEEHRSSCVNDVERLDHMLLLTFGISWDARDVFEIDLPARHRGGPFHGLLDVLVRRDNAVMALEHAINGFAGGDRQLKELQHGVTL
jgi:hypothetical protein